MPTRWKALLVILALSPIATAMPLGNGTARACSCASADAVDAVAMADVVFTGVAVGNAGTENKIVWSFEIDGVVKGEVSSTEAVVSDDWAVGCGTDFSRFNESIVVYAQRAGGRLAALGCMPTPTAREFAARLTAIGPPSGDGPAAAVLSGVVNTSDLAVLDALGRTIKRGSVGAGVVAHCPGTTLVAIAPYEPQGVVNLVDLNTFSLVEQRPIGIRSMSVANGRISCLDGGRQVITVAGYGPNEGSVRIATSNADGTGDQRTMSGISSAVVHAAGTVIALPTIVGEPLTTLSSTDLQAVGGGGVTLPVGASVIDGDISPDGSRLVMLATLSGEPVQYDNGATHALVIDLVDGVPVAGSTTTIELATVGPNAEAPAGAAKWIRWLDEATWVIERETFDTKRIEIISSAGTPVLGHIDVGWGWGLTPVPGGVLRARNGGVEVVGADGTATPGDPGPHSDHVDRTLSVAQLVDAPTLSTEAIDATPALQITPIERTVQAVSTTAVSTTALTPAAIATTDELGGFANTAQRDAATNRQVSDDSMPNLRVVLVPLAALTLSLGLFWRFRAVRRRSAPTS